MTHPKSPLRRTRLLLGPALALLALGLAAGRSDAGASWTALRPPEATPAASAADRCTGPLPAAELFDPLLADPRWPHFSASMQSVRQDSTLSTLASANIGTSVPLYGGRLSGVEWQFGFQAGVFSIFDLETESDDLVNADYIVGFPVSLRIGPFTAQARVFHQSSHLGDEFLLRTGIERLNLAYEAVDLLLSARFSDHVRVYGGAGRLLNSHDVELGKNGAQGGLEMTSPGLLFGGHLCPVVAIDVQSNEESDWELDFSGRAGFEILSETFAGRRFQVMAEYFSGRSPNGQFFDRVIELYGFGVRFY